MYYNSANTVINKQSYKIADDHFMEVVEGYQRKIPWQKFASFFDIKTMPQLEGYNMLLLMKCLALQEVLCLDDRKMLLWIDKQFSVFEFLYEGSAIKRPNISVINLFRHMLYEEGLLLAFRKLCDEIINDANGFSSIQDVEKTRYRRFYDKKIEQAYDYEYDKDHLVFTEVCPRCGANESLRLKSKHAKKTYPAITLLQCKMCGETYKADPKD